MIIRTRARIEPDNIGQPVIKLDYDNILNQIDIQPSNIEEIEVVLPQCYIYGHKVKWIM